MRVKRQQSNKQLRSGVRSAPALAALCTLVLSHCTAFASHSLWVMLQKLCAVGAVLRALDAVSWSV